jgi:hypothetical protein
VYVCTIVVGQKAGSIFFFATARTWDHRCRYTHGCGLVRIAGLAGLVVLAGCSGLQSRK